MPAVRKTKFFPTRRAAFLSPNLPLPEAAAVYLGNLTPEMRQGLAIHFNHLMAFFGTVRLRSIHKLQYLDYARKRMSEGAAASTVEAELDAMKQLWKSCFDADLAWIAEVRR